MWRNKCVKVVLRAQWLVTVEGSWEVVGDSSLVQCKTRFVQIFHIFFFMKQIFVDPPPKLVPRSRSFLRRGRFGYKITSPPSHSLSQLFIYIFCFVTVITALFLSQTISAIKCCSGWELICFLSRLPLFPEESGLDGQNDVVDRVTVRDPHHIFHVSSPPSNYWTLPTEVTFVCKTEVKHGFTSDSVVWGGLFFKSHLNELRFPMMLFWFCPNEKLFPSRNYQSKGYKLWAQRFLWSFGWTSVTHDWLMVALDTIDQ